MGTGLIDVGANLAGESFHHDLDAVLARAWQAGLSKIVVTGSSQESSLQAAELARRYPGKLYATAGLHPHHASDWTPELGKIFRQLAELDAIVSLGECGLDYFRDLSPRDDQRRAFVSQLEIAADSGKPVFLHQRDAHEDFLAILREWRPLLGNVVVHCFTDTREAMNDYLALDCHIGITGWICDERRGAHLIEAVRDIPDDRLLIETDAPYLLPRTAPKQASRRNEPAFLPWVVKALAVARNQSEDEIAELSSANALRFFGLGDLPPSP